MQERLRYSVILKICQFSGLKPDNSINAPVYSLVAAISIGTAVEFRVLVAGEAAGTPP
jgi:hypothetical protein